MADVRWSSQDKSGEDLATPAGHARWVRPTPPLPKPGRRQVLVDLALALVIATPLKASRNYTLDNPEFAHAWIGKGMLFAFSFVMLLALAVRRRVPLAASALAMIELAVVPIPLASLGVGALILAYSAAVYSPYRRLAIAAAAILPAELWATRYDDIVPGDHLLVLLGLPVAVGAALYGAEVRREARADVGERLRQRAERQQQAIRDAVEGERARIARELHDVVTHNVSVMVVMAGAARKTLGSSPEQATAALLEVEAAGRSAMSELRQVMGLLTESVRDRPDLEPQPGLEQLGTLVERIRATGVPIGHRVEGEPRPLPPGLDLTAYRAVQEALTNTVKHASGARVEILVAYRAAELALEITDSGGVPGQAAGAGNGRGLIGLRERVAVHGGTVQAGPRPGGGYRVRVHLPLPVEDRA
jgi:signal transduction histidine kinase